MLAKHVRNINVQHNSKKSATFLLLASCKCFCWTTNFFLDPKLRKTWKRQIEFVRHKTSIEMKKEKKSLKKASKEISRNAKRKYARQFIQQWLWFFIVDTTWRLMENLPWSFPLSQSVRCGSLKSHRDFKEISFIFHFDVWLALEAHCIHSVFRWQLIRSFRS